MTPMNTEEITRYEKFLDYVDGELMRCGCSPEALRFAFDLVIPVARAMDSLKHKPKTGGDKNEADD